MNKMGALFIYSINLYNISNFISSPFLFVIGDDRVIRYTGADDDIGDVVDAQTTEWGLAGIRARRFYYDFIYVKGFWKLYIFITTTL